MEKAHITVPRYCRQPMFLEELTAKKKKKLTSQYVVVTGDLSDTARSVDSAPGVCWWSHAVRQQLWAALSIAAAVAASRLSIINAVSCWRYFAPHSRITNTIPTTFRLSLDAREVRRALNCCEPCTRLCNVGLFLCVCVSTSFWSNLDWKALCKGLRAYFIQCARLLRLVKKYNYVLCEIRPPTVIC